MIKLTKIAALSSSLVIFSGLTAHAFLLPPGPVTPTVDAPTDVTFSLENVGATAQMYAAQAQTYANNMTKAAKSAKKKYMDKFTGFMGGLFKKKEKQAIPGSKTIQESKIADIYDAESVKKALYTLFLAYPVDCEKDADSFAACVAYKEKAEEFYQDTVIEIYTSVRLLEQEMPNLAVQVESLSATFSGGGGDGAESGDDENGARKNAFNAYETMDSILKITQEVTAMKAQYEAALMLREQVKPAPYVSKKERKAKEKAAKEAELNSYETGITYNQLARTPNDYIGKKVKFYGKVIQVIEGTSETQLRLAIGGDYDSIIFCRVPKAKTANMRILENDYITIMGKSNGLLTYESTMGGNITIPDISVSEWGPN